MGCNQSTPVSKPDATGVPATGIDGKNPVPPTTGAVTNPATGTNLPGANTTTNPVKAS